MPIIRALAASLTIQRNQYLSPYYLQRCMNQKNELKLRDMYVSLKLSGSKAIVSICNCEE